MRAGRVAGALAVVGAGTAALLGGVSRRGARRRADRLAATPADHGLHAEVVHPVSEAGTPLHAWWVPTTPGAPAVVVTHGYASHAGDLLPVARWLADAGLAVLLVDVRGHARSPGSGRPTPPVFAADVASAVTWLQARDDVGPVALLGHSMGGSASLLAAAGRDDLAAVVTVSAVADPTLSNLGWWPAGLNRRMLDRVARRTGTDPSRHFAVNRVAEVTAPVLLVHGDRDRLVPALHLDALVAAAAPGTRRLLVPGATHGRVAGFAPAAAEVVAFLREATGATTAAG